MGALKVIPPITITDAVLISSNVTENDYTAWSSATTYSIGNRVILTSTHKVYESLQNSNLNKNPVTEPTFWIEVSPTNRWKMFDTSNSTSTINSNSIVVVLRPSKVVNSVGLLGIDAVSVRVRMIDTYEGVVFDKTYNMNDNGTINDWWQYFFNDIGRKDSLVITDLPSYGTADIEITMTHTGYTVSCATCVIGRMAAIGEGINLGASVGITDYSKKVVDDFGNYQLLKRAYAKKVKYSMAVLNTQIDSVSKLLTEVRSSPCVWIGDDNYTSTMIFGFYKDFDIVIAYHTVSDCNIEIEGLV